LSECTKTSPTVLDIENDKKKCRKKEKIHEQTKLVSGSAMEGYQEFLLH
jgi:hypothetical protein